MIHNDIANAGIIRRSKTNMLQSLPQFTRAMPGAEDGKTLFTVILRDITDRVRADSLLARSEARLRGIRDSAMDANITIDESQLVLDYQLLGGTGVDVLHAVHPKAPSVIFVVLTNHANPQYRRLCLEAGANWFLDKSTEFRKIKGVIAGLASVSE